MFYALLMCCALVGQDAPAAVGHSGDLATYESANAKAGENADAHVQLALWCEAHGLSAQRVKQLALAVMYDPSHALARGLMGLVGFGGKWGKPDEIAQQIQDDPDRPRLMSEYRARRLKTPLQVDDQLKLAQWCERNGLKVEAFAHYSEVIRLDPSRESVWKRLGFKKRAGRWMSAEDFAAEERDAISQKQADKRWRFFFERVAANIESTDPRKQARGEQWMGMVSDARAVPMIWAQFVRVTTQRELAAVRMLGQIEGPSAATGLAAIAVFSPRPEVRVRAKDALVRCDPRDVVEPLIDAIRKPFEFQVQPGSGPGSPSELFVAGERFNIQRFYQSQTAVPAVWGGRMFAPPAAFDPFSSRNLPMANLGSPAQIANRELNARPDLGMSYLMKKSLQSEQGLARVLARDIQQVETANARIHDLNGRVLDVLRDLTGMYLGDDPEIWKAWWADQLGYSYQPSEPVQKPTYTSFATEPPPAPRLRRHHSCFGAGTQVPTLEGPRKIELIQVGDRVLSQNVRTGLLGFEPVLAVYHNKPAPTLKLAIGGDSIVVTGIHRFWKAGKGWIMARELKVGDRVRAVGGVVTVDSIEDSSVQPVFNLEVAENRDYFVGMKQMLVHDYSLVQPVHAPFDREPELAIVSETSN